MLGNLDVDAGDDTWTLKMKDREIASGGRYDRLSFTISKGELASVVTENVLDLLATHSSPFPLAAFEGLVTSDQLKTMTGDSMALEAAVFQRLFGDKAPLLTSNSRTKTFEESLLAHPLESAGVLLGSAMIGMVAMFGLVRLFSPSPKNNHGSYSSVTVLDSSVSPSSLHAKRAAIELEPMRKTTQDHVAL
jgi:hypothetical protein